MRHRTVRGLAAASLVAGIAVITGGTAHAVPPETAPPANTVAQVDGITSRILSNLIVQSDQYFHDGDYNRVVGLTRVIVEGDPNYNDGYENAAYLLWSQGYTPAADDLLKYGLSRTKDKGELSFEFGRHLYTTKRFAEAEPYLAQAVALPNPHPPYYSVLANCYEKNGKIPEAIATWREQIKKFPDFPPGPPNLRRLLEKQSQPK